MINVQDVLLRVNDHLGNYDTGTVKTAQKVRAIDSAVNYVYRKIGTPFNEKKYDFKFWQDTLYYDMPAGFQEGVKLIYKNVNNNTPQNAWNYEAYTDILRRAGSPGRNRWGHTAVNGRHQLILSGYNLNQDGIDIVDSFDNVLWTAEDDASGIAFDTVTKIEGAASQKFTITDSLHEAVVKRTDFNIDVTSLHERDGAFKVYTFMPSVDVTSIEIQYGNNEATDYWSIVTTTDNDGNAYTVNDWNLINFASENKTVTGSPDATNVTFIKIIYHLDTGFGTVANFRLDYLYTSYPDELTVIYLSKVKGETSAGVAIQTITSENDLINADDDYIELIAMRAALYCWPPLKGDLNFYTLMQSELKDLLKTYARSWPRKRNENNFQQTRLRN